MLNKLRNKVKDNSINRKPHELEHAFQELNSKFEYLYYWSMRSDENIRDIISKIGETEYAKEHNDRIFAHKWRFLNKGVSSLENPEHKENIVDVVLKWTGLPAEWFKGKAVLDAGCGDGRLSYGMCKLGANVTSIDKVVDGVQRTMEYCKEFDNHKAFVWDVLTPYDAKEQFDLVLSIGVLHHTGDTQKGIYNLGELVKIGGYFSLMVYGYPRLDHPQDFDYMCRKERIRQAIRHMDGKKAQEYIHQEIGDEMAVRGWFDAVAPRIEDHYTFSQVAMMLQRAHFTDIIHLEPQIRNICVRGKKV